MTLAREMGASYNLRERNEFQLVTSQVVDEYQTKEAQLEEANGLCSE